MTNLTNLTNMHGLFDVAEFVNEATGGIFWAVILICVYIIFVVNLRAEGLERGIVAASFVSMLLSLLLYNIGLVQIGFPIFFIVIMAASTAYMIYKK